MNTSLNSILVASDTEIVQDTIILIIKTFVVKYDCKISISINSPWYFYLIKKAIKDFTNCTLRYYSFKMDNIWIIKLSHDGSFEKEILNTFLAGIRLRSKTIYENYCQCKDDVTRVMPCNVTVQYTAWSRTALKLFNFSLFRGFFSILNIY